MTDADLIKALRRAHHKKSREDHEWFCCTICGYQNLDRGFRGKAKKGLRGGGKDSK